MNNAMSVTVRATPLVMNIDKVLSCPSDSREEWCRKVGAKVPYRGERGAVWKGRRCRLVGVYPYVPNELQARAICLAWACNLFGTGVQSFAKFVFLY